MVSQIDLVASVPLLFGDFGGESDRADGTDFHAGLFPFGAAAHRIPVVRGVGAQSAFCGFQVSAVVLIRRRESPARGIRTPFDTCPATGAFVDIHHSSDIAETSIDFQGTFRAGVDTSRVHTLPALFNGDVVGPFVEWILNDLYPGQGKIFHTFVHQGAGQHTGHASLAFFDIDEQITPGNGQPGPPVGQFDDVREGLLNTGVAADTHAKGDGSGNPQEVPPGHLIVSVGCLFAIIISHDITFPGALNPLRIRNFYAS